MGDIREAIDSIDAQIVQLIAARGAYVHAAAAFKTDSAAVRAPQRVAQVIASKRALAEEHGAAPALVESLYRTMIDYFIAEELQEWQVQNG